jgi:hypothetical protein
MSKDDLTRLVLLGIRDHCEAARSRPRPPEWKWWEIREYENDLEFGPSYSPTWFGEVTASEAGRVRVLRTIYHLAHAGLVTLVKTPGGRLERLKMTPMGLREVRSLLRKAGTPART